MYQLSDKQIDYIFDDISARGVEMESLQQNLLDHICCIIEQNLEANGDFENFYQKTIKTFYKDALWEIEEETILLLTFKNYYTMKKIMIISGTFSAVVMSIGIFFKFMHWPGAALCILLGIVISSLVFLPLLFTLKAKEKQTIKDKLILGLATFSGILISSAVLFKIMHWPGANMMGLTFVIIMLVLYIPLYFFSGIKNPEAKVNTIVTTIIMIMGCGLFLTLVNSRPTTRNLSDSEIEYLANDEVMIKNESEKLNKIAGSDTSLTKSIARAEEIYKICEELKADILEYEIGYKSITTDLKGKNILVSNALVNNLFGSNRELYEKKISRLDKLIQEQRIYCWLEKVRLTKKEEVSRPQILFNSSVLFNDFDFIYYNNTVFGAYKNISDVQLNSIEDLKEFVELKQLLNKQPS
ncbi:MAG: hypothetical protein V4677_17845 [Bacteroidota bacterium]